MSIRIISSIVIAALGSLGLYAQTGQLDYSTYPVNYEELVEGGENLGAGGYFNARWYIDGTQLQRLCIGQSDLSELLSGTGCLLMIGSEGDDYVKRCMYGYVEPYGKNLYVLGLSSLCYVFCFDNETVIASKGLKADSDRGDNVDYVIAIMSLFYEKATKSHGITAKAADYLLYCLANDLFGDLIRSRGGKRYSRFSPYENLQNEYTEVIVTVLYGESYSSDIEYDETRLRYFSKNHKEQVLDRFYSECSSGLSGCSVMEQIQNFVDYSRREMNNMSPVEYEENVMLDIIGLLTRYIESQG